MTRNELWGVGSDGGYFDHGSVGIGFILQDLSWPSKSQTVYRDGPLVVIFVIRCI